MKHRTHAYALVVGLVGLAGLIAAIPALGAHGADRSRKSGHGRAFTIHGSFLPGDPTCHIPGCEETALLNMESFDLHGKVLGSKMERAGGHGRIRYKRTRYLVRDIVLHGVSGRCMESDPNLGVQFSPWTVLAKNLSLPARKKVISIEWEAPGYLNPKPPTTVDQQTGAHIHRPLVELFGYGGDIKGIDIKGSDVVVNLTRYRLGRRRPVHSYAISVEASFGDSWHYDPGGHDAICNGGNEASAALSSKLLPRG